MSATATKTHAKRVSVGASPGSGVLRFIARNLEEILGRHEADLPAQTQHELHLLLEAMTELAAIPGGQA